MIALERGRSFVQADVVGLCALECSYRLLALTAPGGELREQLPRFGAIPLGRETAAQFLHGSVRSAELGEQLHVTLLDFPIRRTSAARQSHTKEIRSAGFLE